MGKLVTAANAVMMVLFLVCVALQYNDPDPYYWMPLYGGGALACFLRWRRMPHRLVATVVGLVAVVWAGFLVPQVVGKSHFADMFEAWKAMTPESERARELGGLLIVAAWTLLLALSRRHKIKG